MLPRFLCERRVDVSRLSDDLKTQTPKQPCPALCSSQVHPLLLLAPCLKISAVQNLIRPSSFLQGFLLQKELTVQDREQLLRRPQVEDSGILAATSLQQLSNTTPFVTLLPA